MLWPFISDYDSAHSLIEFTATTHPGNRYQLNEDAIGWSEKAGIWFVADGIGGHARGDLASATVKKALLEVPAQPPRSLKKLVMLAHEAVLLEGIEQSLTNMGSTLVLARIRDNRLNVAWCGDSRAYLFRAGKLTRLTRDHSLLEQLLESGAVTPQEAFGHPRRNVLVQALGINSPPPQPSEIALTLDNDDLVILCSDGIHDELHDDHIAELLSAMNTAGSASTQAIVDEIERRVLATDARDNLSAICLRVNGLAALESDQPTVLRSIETKTTVGAKIATPPVPVRDEAHLSEDLAVSHSAPKTVWIAIAGAALLLALALLFV